MKRLTTIICAVCFMVAGVSLVIYKDGPPGYKEISAQQFAPLQWNVKQNALPLDLQLDLDKRLQSEHPTKDSVVIKDSVRYIDKVRWRIRYKDGDNRASLRRKGEVCPIIPDSIPAIPHKDSTKVREEQTLDTIGPPKESIILIVDGEEVYKR